jgi:hypothetical protein
VAEAEERTRLTVFPNPASDQLNLIAPPHLRNAAWTVHDLGGRVVLQGMGGTSLDVRHLPAGTYLLRMEKAAVRFVKR